VTRLSFSPFRPQSAGPPRTAAILFSTGVGAGNAMARSGSRVANQALMNTIVNR